MLLGEIFNSGHTVAHCRGPRRVVVRCPNPPAPEGWWVVREAALPAVVYRKDIATPDLGGTLGAVDMQATHWEIDREHCWCPNCVESRRFLETHDE